jgi:hypothetical protein
MVYASIKNSNFHWAKEASLAITNIIHTKKHMMICTFQHLKRDLRGMDYPFCSVKKNLLVMESILN